MDHHERTEWALKELIARIEQREQQLIELKRTFPWIVATLLLGGFVAGVSFARIWWDI